jgi:hypothetical protein
MSDNLAASGEPDARPSIQGVPQSPYRQAIRKLGGESANSVPIPLLVLAGLGSLLLLTAGGLATTKWIKTARLGRGRPPTAKPEGRS